MNTEKILEEIGLTKGEIKVYLALLKIGETTTGKIIEEAQISSGKIYEILEKLSSKGLVTHVVKEKTKHFSAVSPNRILDFLHERENILKQKEDDLIKELPNLLAMENASKIKYGTRLFKGIRGIQTAIFETLENLNDKEIFAMGIISHKDEKFNLLWQRWHTERIKKKIICKAIFSDKNSEYYKDFRKMKYTEVKYIEGITPSAIDIIGDSVLIFTYENEPSCLLIKNEEISQSFKTFFQTMWDIPN
ncbi:MAG: helix-turn-helix domain-containing protein [Nanoarchaeota archaeon]|nr:helix-turn-helix domain-containing protein [Nanoarchaeota archaeon]